MIPRKSELVPIVKSESFIDIKPSIEAALDNDDLIEKIEPYRSNGDVESPTGSHRIDNVRTMDLIMAFDKTRGNLIATSGLKEVVILNQINTCLRRRYQMDKHGKILGPNPKRYVLIGHDAK